MERWRHNDTDHLRRIVEKRRGEFDRIIVMAESVYSMDGDIAPLEELCGATPEFPEIMLYIDEAHAFGVFGKKGLGVAESLGLIDETDIIVGTFGKSLRLLRRLCIDFGDTARLSCERRARAPYSRPPYHQFAPHGA